MNKSIIIKFKIFLVKLTYFIINDSLAAITRILFCKLPTNTSRNFKILILRNGSIGDCVTSFPAIASVNQYYQDAKIDILTNSGSDKFIGMKELLDTDFYNKIINYFNQSYLNLFSEIKKTEYDIFINLSQDKSTWIREFNLQIFIKLCGIKYATGFEIGTVRFLLKTQNSHMYHFSEKNRLLQVLVKSGIPTLREKYPIKKSTQRETSTSLIMESKKMSPNKNIVAIVIGGKRIQNQWPIDYWKELIPKILRLNYNIVILGGLEDNKNAEHLMQNDVYNFCGETSIQESLEIISKCKMVISNDTGPMHLSYAIGIPTIGIFSAWQLSNIWFPETPDSAVLVDFSLNCSLCYSNKCKDNICMQRVSPEMVFEKFKLLLQSQNESQPLRG